MVAFARAFHANGNRTNSGWRTGAANQLLSDGTFNYTYDNERNRATRTRISTAYAADHLTEYEWDYHNNLTKVTYKDNSNVETGRVEYSYDDAGRRIRKKVTVSGDSDYDYLAYQGNSPLLEFFDDDGLGNSGSSPVLFDRYLNALDQVLADYQPDIGPDGKGDILRMALELL